MAVPGVLQQGVVAAGNIAIQGVVNVYGAAVMAGYSAAVKMNNLVTACFSTIGSGVSNFTAQNLGAARPERLRGGFRASVWLVWTIALTMCLIYELIPGRLVRVFLTDASDKALKTGVDFRRIAAPFYFAPAVKIMCDGVLCGADKMKHVVFTIFLDLFAARADGGGLLGGVRHGVQCVVRVADRMGYCRGDNGKPVPTGTLAARSAGFKRRPERAF